MKKYTYLMLAASLIMWGCEPAPTPAPEPDPEPQKVLVAPSNPQVEVVDGVRTVITWENASTDYDGVALEKAAPGGRFKSVANIPAGTFRYDDSDFSENGDYLYRLCSFKGNQFTDYVRVGFTIDGIPDPTPAVQIDKIETASNMIVVRYTITDDMGKNVENGIEWEDGKFTYWKKLGKDASGLGVIMNPDGPVTVRAYAKLVSENVTGYSEPQTVEPEAEPLPYAVEYTDITPSDLPSEIKVYKASTTVTGRPTNIWYSIADLSTGNVELRVLCPDSGKKTTSSLAKAKAGTPYVFTNGGYFGGNASVSYILDQGTQKAENESFLARTKSYYASRGVFGITSAGESSVCWRFGRSVNGGPYFYDTPIPQIDGAAVESPTATYPSQAITPGYYSAIGGGPVLVKDGKTRINFLMEGDVYLSNFELFPSDIYSKTTRQPRTAIGRTEDGKVVLMVVDGRKSGVSEGVVLTDLARLMQGVGCVDVMNLDGGGSSVMCAGTGMTVLNNPSDGSERAVVSIVGFAKK